MSALVGWVVHVVGRAFLAAAPPPVLGAVLSVLVEQAGPVILGGALAPVAFGAVTALSSPPRPGPPRADHPS